MSIEAFDCVLAAARAGAEWALTILYRELHPRVLRYLSARERVEAEDVASEVWLDVASGLHRFEGDEAGFRAWVFTIARRRLLDLRRRAAVRKTAPTPHEMLGGDRGIGNVEEEALAALGTDEALTWIADLSPDQADVVLLRVLGDLSVGEVAAIVHKRPGAVRALQHRALRKLARTVSRELVTE
jgi:RNA polymerase sigma-70 factor (ECF subfamily)